MTKKHFETFAGEIKRKQDSGVDMTEAKDLVCKVAHQLCPRFDEAKFREACQPTLLSEAKHHISYEVEKPLCWCADCTENRTTTLKMFSNQLI